MSEGLSAQQIAELRVELEEILRLLKEVKPETEHHRRVLQQEIALLTSVLSLTRRMGLPEDVEAQVIKIQNLIMLLVQLRATILALQAAAGPYGWFMAGISGLALAVTATSTYEAVGR